jgi:hypothetical protein
MAYSGDVHLPLINPLVPDISSSSKPNASRSEAPPSIQRQVTVRQFSMANISRQLTARKVLQNRL